MKRNNHLKIIAGDKLSLIKSVFLISVFAFLSVKGFGQDASLSLSKVITSGDPYAAVDDVVNYEYTITNTGNVSLAGPFTITDDLIGTIGPLSGPLSPGGTIVTTGSYTITQADLDAGSVTNTASVSDGTVTSGDAIATATASQTPSWTLSKVGTESSYNTAGEILYYTITLSNTGNVTITGVNVADPSADITPGVVRDVDQVGNNDNNLEVGEIWIYSVQHTVNTGDVTAGSYTNTATVSGIPAGGSLSDIAAVETINVIPEVIVTDPPAVCSPSTVDLTASSITSGSTSGLTYTYWLDELATIEFTTPTVANDGTYYIKGTTVEGYFDIAPVTVIVNPVPTTSDISGTTNPACNGTGYNYSVTLNEGSSYVWTVPDGATITSGETGPDNNEITVDFGSTNGDVTVTETNIHGCVGNTKTLSVSLAGCDLEANFTGSPLQTCIGSAVTFTDISTGITGSTTYSWDFGSGADPATANTAGPHTVTYSTSGLKTVILTITDGASNTETKTDYISVTPDVTIDPFSPAESERCQGAEILIYTTSATNSTGITYNMDATSLAAGNTINESTGEVTFVDIWYGITTITATAAGCNGPATTTHVVTVNQKPNVDITGNSDIYVSGTTTIFPTSGGTWSSNNPAVASVTDAGLVTGLSAGKATFTFTETLTGCSNTTSEVTVFALPVVFTPVWWPGNGIDHMNLYALTATLDGLDLQPGDEIGIFDGTVCVGAGVINTVLTGSNYLSLIVSRDDPDTPEIDGYITGNPIIFKIWDSSESTEITYVEADYVSGQGQFLPGGSSTFNLSGINPISQTILLDAGWNILSFPAEPDDMSMLSIVDPLITEGKLIKVQDESGNAIEELPFPIGWVDNIGSMSMTEGYKIKVTENTSLDITGKPAESPFEISLTAGWNIMGYPFASGQETGPVFDPLISTGSLLKVQDESGNAIEELPFPIGWIDNIYNLIPGEGYKIKTNVDATLTVTSGTTKGGIITDYRENPQPMHFNPVYAGNGLGQMNLYILNPFFDGTGLKTGDEIGVFDGDICVGVGIVSDQGKDYLSVITSMDDPTTPDIDGFIEGHPFVLKLWRNETGVEIPAKNVITEKGYTENFVKNGTSVLVVDFIVTPETYLGDAYPNPSHDLTNFTFNLEKKSSVRLEIINSMGELVEVLIEEDLPEGEHIIEWNNTIGDGQKIDPGIYFYRLSTTGYSMTKTLVVF